MHHNKSMMSIDPKNDQEEQERQEGVINLEKYSVSLYIIYLNPSCNASFLHSIYRLMS
jgi:hypothetical protein